MIGPLLKSIKRIFAGGIVIYGVWLLLWDPVDFTTQGFNTGIWDWSVMTNAYPSMFIGLMIIIIGAVVWHVRAV